VGRIEKYHARRFGLLLQRRRVPDPQTAVDTLFEAARQASAKEGLPLSFTLARCHAALVRNMDNRRLRARFVCDAGLGGLARWLRGCGYEAAWMPELDDAAVIREAQARGAMLITTDSLMMERGVLRDELVPSLFVPSTLTCEQQLEIVFRELGLTVQASRCMKCGGELCPVDKQTILHRVPSRTAVWLDEYFVCAGCGQLFWHGTHWRHVQERLALLT
jgi:uncharacterized protein with PIN domain